MKINFDNAVDPKEQAAQGEMPIESEKISLTDADDKRKSQATLLIELGSQNTLFHCPQKDAYAEIIEQGITKILPLRCNDFKEFLGHEFFKLTGKGANTTAIADALNTLEAIAKHKGGQHTVYLRLANLGDKIYLDIGCDKWRVIEITKAGWRVLDKSPVKFYRRRGMTALPDPEKGGNIDQLKPFVNVEPDDFVLVIAWLMSVLGGIKPYPILVLQGEQGSGKSSTCRILRALTDPSTVPLRSPPKEARDLLVSAANNYLVVLDNLSGLSHEISDHLCRLSTGGGIDVRSLYTDSEQLLIDIQRPILSNGIDDLASRPDLAERSIHLELPLINDGKRTDEEQFYADFGKVKGEIFGALLTGLVGALGNIEKTVLLKKPRMADFAKWVAAAESGLGWQPGKFMEVYRKNLDTAIEASIESSPVGMAIMDLVKKHPTWTGTPTELMSELGSIAGSNHGKLRTWPQSTKGLNNVIKRLMPSFRRLGVQIDQSRAASSRLYKIRRVGFYPSYPSYPSQPSNGAAYDGYDAYDGYSGTYPNDKDVERF